MKKIVTTNLFKIGELEPVYRDFAIRVNKNINTKDAWWEMTYEDAASVGLAIKSFDLHHKTIDINFTEPSIDVASHIIDNHGEDTESYKAAIEHRENVEAIRDTKVPNGSIFMELAEKLFIKVLGNEYLRLLSAEHTSLTSDEAVIATLNDSPKIRFDEHGKRYNGELVEDGVKTGYIICWMENKFATKGGNGRSKMIDRYEVFIEEDGHGNTPREQAEYRFSELSRMMADSDEIYSVNICAILNRTEPQYLT